MTNIDWKNLDWGAFMLSMHLAMWTVLVLIFIGLFIAHKMACRQFPGRGVLEAVVALPLVLPPTVLGYYLLVGFNRDSALGQLFESLTGQTLVFSFQGLLLASIISSLPFSVQPMLRAFEGIPQSLREAAWCCGLSRWQTFLRVEIPLAWPGVLSGMVLTFAHTMGEFGVVLMVGGNISGETRTVSIAIFDRAQAFDDTAVALMSLLLLGFAFITVTVVYSLENWRRAKR